MTPAGPETRLLDPESNPPITRPTRLPQPITELGLDLFTEEGSLLWKFLILFPPFFYRQWLLEALPYVYKEEVFELIAEKTSTRDLEPKLAVSVLRGLGLTTNTTEKMCRDISVSGFFNPVYSLLKFVKKVVLAGVI